MGKILSINQAIQEIKRSKQQEKIIVLVGGCFDVLHRGHIEFLHNAKNQGNVLIVLVESDETVRRLKGINRPINNQNDRAFILANLMAVDIAVPLTPLSSDQEYYDLVKTLEPDIIAVTKGDRLIDKKKEQAKIVNGKVVAVINRKKNYSTQETVKKIKN